MSISMREQMIERLGNMPDYGGRTLILDVDAMTTITIQSGPKRNPDNVYESILKNDRRFCENKIQHFRKTGFFEKIAFSVAELFNSMGCGKISDSIMKDAMKMQNKRIAKLNQAITDLKTLGGKILKLVNKDLFKPL